LLGLGLPPVATFAVVEVDVLILGRGIAGAVLAEVCRMRGLSVHVFDHVRDGAATPAAGGALNPVVLRRNTLCWRGSEMMPAARTFFRAWEQRTGVSCWTDLPLVKLFASDAEARQWEKAVSNPATAPFLSDGRDAAVEAAPLNRAFGYGLVTCAARVDIHAFLETQRQSLLKDGQLTERDVAESEIVCHGNHIRIGDVGGPWLVQCTGPFHKEPGLSLVKGETLHVKIPDLHLQAMVHQGIGLLPAADGSWVVGSTFKWTDVWEGPTRLAREWMLERVADMVDAPVEVVGHHAGVRPAARDRKPILGRSGPCRAVINGLGARGVMQAPWCATHLLAHLFDGVALEGEVDRARYT
jgi:glycine/D-amino acid oxidase-like deaminating enzyme